MLDWLTGGGFSFNVVTANLNEYQAGSAPASTWGTVGVHAHSLLIAVGLFLLLARLVSRLPSWRLVAPYLSAPALSGLTIGKVGSNVNYLLELGAAVSLAIGALIAWQRPRPLVRHAADR